VKEEKPLLAPTSTSPDVAGETEGVSKPPEFWWVKRGEEGNSLGSKGSVGGNELKESSATGYEELA